MERIELFDGESLDGWKMSGPGGFDVVDGTLVSRGGMGLLWWPGAEFGDFTLEVEWRVERPSDNSGVFVLFPDPGDDPWVAVDHGYEVQILDEADDAARRTGAVYRLAPPTADASRPAGEWNRLEIGVAAERLTVVLNGTMVTTYQGEKGRRRGFVGLQNHDERSRVAFRNVVVEAADAPG